MTRFGITFNGKHSFKDFGLTVAERIIGNPKKIKIKERVPFSNKAYDFSGIYGDQEYEERPLTYVFNVKDYDKINLENKKTEVANWFMGPNRKVKLIDDYIFGYHFLAEVEEDLDFDELRFHGKLTVNFTAYPFRIADLEEGNDIWDEFNFLLDYSQDTEFSVSGSSNAVLYNAGIKTVYPIIKSNATMEISKNGVVYSIPIGESQSLDFALLPGENNFRINGNGKISFHFRKELI
ncbi:phage tail domain-containing protein [Bacillus sp. B15-48]|uniref:phage tail domain-containing protein n=1 Tax=Bacillus sp. B15-48 TaxID=1548601 RepID=UPI00193FF378|nr:phage tail domain-containing protein [Bacillus sp. B15-48]MBM4762702.1 phage tail protein [Bacillus sp. B15-48]